ncbi:MAG: alpha/beta hydrolase [Pedosphaera sp.]|nr:alpha/beta hydrolase [Pedosphaera sp.]
MRSKLYLILMLAGLLLSNSGCGTFMANRMAQAPNTYPTWFAPKPRVQLGFHPKFLTNFPAFNIEVSSPRARLRYRLVEPADYNLQYTSTNWFEQGQTQFEFNFRADVPGPTNHWTVSPRGTAIILHGYGVSQFAMAPWALRLAQEGWRCVLVDLRGHGKSTGRRIYFGLEEIYDLTQLLDKMSRDGQLVGPVAVLGESYGAALALRWKTVEPRVGPVVAIAPYAILSNAVLNIAKDYVSWTPKSILKSGLNNLPSVLNVDPAELDTATILARSPVSALFIAGAEDKVTSLSDMKKLYQLATPDSKLIVVPRATHEAVTYFFNDLAGPVTRWLNQAH